MEQTTTTAETKPPHDQLLFCSPFRMNDGRNFVVLWFNTVQRSVEVLNCGTMKKKIITFDQFDKAYNDGLVTIFTPDFER